MHDFARNSSHRNRTQQKKPRKPAVPKRLILITVLLTGGLAFGLYKLTDVNPTGAPASDVIIKTKPVAKSKPVPHKKSVPKQDIYDFYMMLPESEVTVPQVEAYISKRPAAPDQKYNYLLQAGSFRSAEQADKLRAKLLLQGLDAKTRRIKNNDGSIWHRVMIGPFTSRSSLNKAQDILVSSNTESIAVRVKK